MSRGKKTMLDYCKEVLTKLSFNEELFKNELKKSLKWLNDREKNELRGWCEMKFNRQINF